MPCGSVNQRPLSSKPSGAAKSEPPIGTTFRDNLPRSSARNVMWCSRFLARWEPFEVSRRSVVAMLKIRNDFARRFVRAIPRHPGGGPETLLVHSRLPRRSREECHAALVETRRGACRLLLRQGITRPRQTRFAPAQRADPLLTFNCWHVGEDLAHSWEQRGRHRHGPGYSRAGRAPSFPWNHRLPEDR